jgi:cytochrome b6-f complex iron-sulfur subunit
MVDKQRRNFLSRITRVLGGVAVLQAGWVAMSALLPDKRKAPLSDRTGVQVAGPVDQFAPGSVTAFSGGKFFLTRLEDGGFLAVYRKCTHLGCSVPWNAEEQRFTCPCHASAFDIRGDVISAPAPRPLDLFPVIIEDGMVSVDTSRPLRRKVFAPDQVARV